MCHLTIEFRKMILTTNKIKFIRLNSRSSEESIYSSSSNVCINDCCNLPVIIVISFYVRPCVSVMRTFVTSGALIPLNCNRTLEH